MRNRIVSKPTKKGRIHVLSVHLVNPGGRRKKAGHVLHYGHRAEPFLGLADGGIPRKIKEKYQEPILDKI